MTRLTSRAALAGLAAVLSLVVLPGSAQGQVRHPRNVDSRPMSFVWALDNDSSWVNADGSSDRSVLHCTATRYLKEFVITFSGRKSALAWLVGGEGPQDVPYVVTVDDRPVPCEGGACTFPLHVAAMPDNGYFQVLYKRLEITTGNAPWAFTPGGHEIKVSIPGWAPFDASEPGDHEYGIGDCRATEVAPPPPPPTAAALPEYRIRVERNRTTDESYTGVVADGSTRLRFQLDLPGVASVRAVAARGHFENEAGASFGAEIPLSGVTEVFYRPPAYVDTLWIRESSRLVELPDPVSSTARWTLASGAVEEIRFDFVDANGQTQTRQGEILVTRPPVVMVHGFLGDRRTWSDFADFLHGYDFATRADDYYETDEAESQSVRAQAQRLRRVLADERLRYAKAGIKPGKADLVTHSMGGLIARYYTHQYENYDGDVRKVVMIGTPNHGIDRVWRNVQGRMGTVVYSAHSGMKTDVYYRSDFLSRLNRGEDAGAHLNPDVQHGNVYDRFDDRVTTGSSATLQGVSEIVLPGRRYVHSSFIGSPTILEAGETRRGVLRWLLGDIPRGPFTTWDVRVSPEQPGGAFLNGEALTASQTGVTQGDELRAGPGSRAAVTWLLNGHRFANAVLEPGSELTIGYYSPWSVRVIMTRGSGTFRSFDSPGVEGEISVLVADPAYSGTTYDQAISADLTTFGTTFAVRMEGDAWEVSVLDGRVAVNDGRTPGAAELRLDAGAEVRLIPSAAPRRGSVAASGWWERGMAWADRAQSPATTQPPGRTGPAEPPQPPPSSDPGGVTMADVYALEAYPFDLQGLGPRITARAEAGFTPVGLALNQGQIHVLYLGSGVMPITEWQMDWYDTTDQLQAGINRRMGDGYLPNGFSWRSGRYYVLYVRTDFTGTAWQIVTSDVDLQAVNRDLQPWLAEDYIPFDVTLAEGRYMTLLVQLPEEIAESWSLDGAYPDGMRDLIEEKLMGGFFPWGLLVDEVANVLFLGG